MIPQTNWIERVFNFNYPAGLFPIIFSRLEGTIFRLQRILANTSEDKCSKNANGWSVKEHLGHLADLEPLWWARLQDFLNGKEVLTAADMTNAKTTEALHNYKQIDQLLTEFITERQKMLEEIYGFGEDTLNLTALHPRLQQSMRLVDSLYFVAEHDDHHISAISMLLRKQEL